ncbi:MAG: ABC transporter permease [Anaerolineaceae bacterium]|nr:ABC transporter permease [Anaerolineaceae bacterium]
MRTSRRFFSRWQNWLGLLLVSMFVVVAIFAPLLSPKVPEDPSAQKAIGRVTRLEPQPPSTEAPLGTTASQYSVYHALVWGSRSAIVFGLMVTIFSAFIGILVGTTSAYFGGFINSLLMRISDAFLSFPIIAGVVLVQQIVTSILYDAGVAFMRVGGTFPGTKGVFFIPENLSAFLTWLQQFDPIPVAFILFSWMPYARLMNTAVLKLKNTEYVEAARVAGVKNFRIIFRHLIPNSIAPVIVMTAKDVGGMVLLQTTFTFIGLGGNSPWGELLALGRDWIISAGGILTYWWVFLPATVALLLFGIGWNLLGDGLNDALNPRTQVLKY